MFMSFFSKHALGIDISDFSIEMLELKEKGGELRVVAYRRLELPQGIVTNGRIIEQQLLISKIIETGTLPGYGHFTTKSVVASLPESQSYTHLFRLPSVVSDQQLGEAIQYEAEEMLPLFWDQVIHDYQAVRKDENVQDVLYVACQKDIVRSYQEVISRAGFTLEALESEAASLARALVSPQATDPVLIIDCGARTTIITVYDQQAIHFSENIPIAGEQITESLAGKLSLSKIEAESMKKKTGLLSAPTAQAIEPILAKVIEAINKIINLYQKNTGRAVKQLILCGGTSLLPGLVQYLSKQVRVHAVLGNPLESVQKNDKLFNTQAPILYATVMGLAKRGLNEKRLGVGINLLRHAETKENPVKRMPEKKPAAKPTGQLIHGSWVARNKRGLALLGVFGFLVLVFIAVYFIRMKP